MSCAPARLQSLNGAPQGARFWSGLRCVLVPRLLPRFAVSQRARKNKRTATSSPCSHLSLCARILPAQSQHQLLRNINSNPASASGARHTPAMHRTCQRVFFSRRQGFATPLRALDGIGAVPELALLAVEEKNALPSRACAAKIASRKICSQTGASRLRQFAANRYRL